MSALGLGQLLSLKLEVSGAAGGVGLLQRGLMAAGLQRDPAGAELMMQPKKQCGLGRKGRKGRSCVLRKQLVKFKGKENLGAAASMAQRAPSSAGSGPGRSKDLRCTTSVSGHRRACSTLPLPGESPRGVKCLSHTHNYVLLPSESDLMHRIPDCSSRRLPLDINYYVNPAD